jgi:hypothetical protein
MLLCLNRSIGNPKRFNLQTSLANYLTLTKPEKSRDKHAVVNAQALSRMDNLSRRRAGAFSPAMAPRKKIVSFPVRCAYIG